MQASTRTCIAAAIIASCVALPIVACTDGTTPDCSSAEAGCSPDLSGSLESGTEGGDGNTTYGDAAPVDSSKPPPPDDAGDASLDAADAHG
jgi:hypothetical protein